MKNIFITIVAMFSFVTCGPKDSEKQLYGVIVDKNNMPMANMEYYMELDFGASFGKHSIDNYVFSTDGLGKFNISVKNKVRTPFASIYRNLTPRKNIGLKNIDFWETGNLGVIVDTL